MTFLLAVLEQWACVIHNVLGVVLQATMKSLLVDSEQLLRRISFSYRSLVLIRPYYRRATKTAIDLRFLLSVLFSGALFSDLFFKSYFSDLFFESCFFKAFRSRLFIQSFCSELLLRAFVERWLLTIFC